MPHGHSHLKTLNLKVSHKLQKEDLDDGVEFEELLACHALLQFGHIREVAIIAQPEIRLLNKQKRKQTQTQNKHNQNRKKTQKVQNIRFVPFRDLDSAAQAPCPST